ncbi:hypothetical protein ACFKIT_003756 [Vibrio alginolyticus]
MIEKKGIDWDVTIQSLILDDDQTQETHAQQLRNISQLLKMSSPKNADHLEQSIAQYRENELRN